MSVYLSDMPEVLNASSPYRAAYAALRAAFADGPVADTAEPVAAEAGVVGAEPDRDDGDMVGHR